MTFKCPYCKVEIEAENDEAGAIGNCPNCGKKIRIPSIRHTRSISYKKHGHMLSACGNESEHDNDDALCFWLGFLFSLFGVLISAIVGKGRGVKKAFKGMLVSLVLGILIVGSLVFLVTKRETEKYHQKVGQLKTQHEKFEKRMQEIDAEAMEQEKISDTELNMFDVGRGVDKWIEKHHKVPDSYQQVCSSYYQKFNELTEQQDVKPFIEPNKQKDSWGREYMIVVKECKQDGNLLTVEYTIRSAGPDGVFKTNDDLLKKQYVWIPTK